MKIIVNNERHLQRHGKHRSCNRCKVFQQSHGYKLKYSKIAFALGFYKARQLVVTSKAADSILCHVVMSLQLV